MSHRQVQTAIQGLAIVTALAVTVGVSYSINRKVRSCGGINGFLRLIWEGDHLPPDVREAVDALDDLESNAVPREEKRLEKVEIATETARLNSVDGPSNEDIFEQYPQIKKDLSMLSYRLDKLASECDSVRSCGNADVKRRKKSLSNKLVQMMEQTDAIMISCGGGIIK